MSRGKKKCSNLITLRVLKMGENEYAIKIFSKVKSKRKIKKQFDFKNVFLPEQNITLYKETSSRQELLTNISNKIQRLEKFIIKNQKISVIDENNLSNLESFSKKLSDFFLKGQASKEETILKCRDKYKKMSILVENEAFKDILQSDDKQFSLKTMAERYGTSHTTIKKYLNNICNFKYKTTSSLNYRAVNEDFKFEKLAFTDYILKEIRKQKDFIFFDQSSFIMTKRNKKRWIKIGEKNVSYDPENYIRYNLLLACNCKGVLYWEMHTTNFNKIAFEEFIYNLNKVIEKKEEESEEYKMFSKTVILDNSKCQKSVFSFEKFDNLRFDFAFLPKYSPYLNAIEFYFQILKREYYQNFFFMQ